MSRTLRLGLLWTIIFTVILTASVYANEAPLVRAKDVARIQGTRDNQLTGLGLVIGLSGSGDGTGTIANVQMIANMLERFGITVDADALRLRNVAAVMVTADISSSVRNGDRIDVTVSSIGDARSLQGGVLLQTPLQAANGEIYAVAAGSVSIGGFVVRGGGGSVQQNHTTVGMVPNGAIVEQEIPQNIVEDNKVSLVLQQPDFSTSAQIANTINQMFSPGIAQARDQSTIIVDVPVEYQENVVGFIAELEDVPVRPDVNARVVINERTGTVVMGGNVRLATIALTHGNLNVKVDTSLVVEQPPGFVGETVVGLDYDINVDEQSNNLMLMESNTNVEDLVETLNAIGATPRDIIAILQAIKAAGALYGELIIL